MKKYNIPFSPPDMSELEIQYVTETLRSGWITTGPKTKTLEKKIAEYVEADGCICLNSQTAAAETCLRILGIGKGDEVITTAYTYTATASVIEHIGATIKLIDISKDKLEMDYTALENAINENTKAIIPVDLGGVPCDYDKIFEIVESKKNLFKPNGKIQEKIGRVVVIADTAHSLGATYKGKPTGSVADFSNFSFHAVKNFTTAEGGAMTWKSIDGISDSEIYQKGQLLSLHGQNKDALAKSTVCSWEYDILGTWYKCNMTDIMASIGLAQFERYPEMLKRRKEIINKYDNAFKPLGIKTLPHYTDNYSSSGHLYITRIPNVTDEIRREIIEKMAERGVSCNVHYKPLPMFTAYKNLGFDIKDYQNAYDFYVNEITLPLYTKLTDEQVDYIIETYVSFIKGYLK